ncbi:MAG: COX15/CtaA family protein, partial [Verrucomicrobiota bacterium]
GKLWPATDPDSILRYNQQRVEVSVANPITAFQIYLHMTHRIVALLILAAVAFWVGVAIRRLGARHSLAKLAMVWLGLILTQVGLGIATVLSNKAADIATLHVIVGVLSLATGGLVCIFVFRSLDPLPSASLLSGDVIDGRASAG